jgi:DNA-binding NarL/FixJ family response regulator
VEFGNSFSDAVEAYVGGIERCSERPHYTEATLQQKLRRSNCRAVWIAPGTDRSSDATLYLRERDFARAVSGAGLTNRQREVFLARTNGDTWEEIGRRHGHSKQGACHIFRQAMRKIRRTLRENPLRGLATVYREEVSRCLPVRQSRRFR